MKFDRPLAIQGILDLLGHPVATKGTFPECITGINEMHSAAQGDITFVDCGKYYHRVLAGDASVILIDRDTDCPEGKGLIITADPLNDYLAIVRHFARFHPQAQAVHPGTEIGEGTVIQPLVFIGEDVRIGRDCIIHSHVSLYGHTVIGDRVVIHSNTTVGADACYFQRRPSGWLKLTSCGDIRIGNDVEIGCNCCIDRGVSGTTSIGDGCKFDNLVQVGHDAQIGRRVLLGAQSAIAGCTRIDDDCSVWAKACVNKDLYVAKNTTLLACSGIDKSVNEEGSTLFGIPATEAHKKWKEQIYIRNLSGLYRDVAEIKKSLGMRE